MHNHEGYSAAGNIYQQLQFGWFCNFVIYTWHVTISSSSWTGSRAFCMDCFSNKNAASICKTYRSLLMLLTQCPVIFSTVYSAHRHNVSYTKCCRKKKDTKLFSSRHTMTDLNTLLRSNQGLIDVQYLFHSGVHTFIFFISIDTFAINDRHSMQCLLQRGEDSCVFMVFWPSHPSIIFISLFLLI